MLSSSTSVAGVVFTSLCLRGPFKWASANVSQALSTNVPEDIRADFCYVQIVNPKGEMKGSAITGPVGKEAAELWPVSQRGTRHDRMTADSNYSVSRAIQGWSCEVVVFSKDASFLCRGIVV